jgi:hypothetical protein
MYVEGVAAFPVLRPSILTSTERRNHVKKNYYATICLVLGIFSFIRIFNVEKPILAFVFGILALRDISRDPSTGGKGQAIAGIALSIMSIILTAWATYLFMPQIKQMDEVLRGIVVTTPTSH